MLRMLFSYSAQSKDLWEKFLPVFTVRTFLFLTSDFVFSLWDTELIDFISFSNQTTRFGPRYQPENLDRQL